MRFPFNQHLFSQRLRSIRDEMGLTQAALAYEAGIGGSQVSNFELGKAEPTASTLCKLSVRLGVSTDYLCGLSDNRGCVEEACHES